MKNASIIATSGIRLEPIAGAGGWRSSQAALSARERSQAQRDNELIIMETTKRTLPDFEDPPAVETLVAVHFLPLTGWRVVHFGLFWDSIRGSYPSVQVYSPVISPGTVLRFEAGGTGQPEDCETDPPVRCWFLNPKHTTLIQVQRNCFIHNWRREPGGEYLHYDVLRPMFLNGWRNFCSFLERQGVSQPRILRCEVTYVNHVDRGKGWDSPSDLREVFPSWTGSASGDFLPPPTAVAIQAYYPMRQMDGQLEINLQPAIRKTDSKETIQLTVSGQCRPASRNESDLMAAVDAAREWVVRGFTDFTSAKMHQIWRRAI